MLLKIYQSPSITNTLTPDLISAATAEPTVPTIIITSSVPYILFLPYLSPNKRLYKKLNNFIKLKLISSSKI